MADRTSGPQGPGGPGGSGAPRRGFFTRNPLLLAILAVLALLAISNYFNAHNQVEWPYSEFRRKVEAYPELPAGTTPERRPSTQPKAADTGFGSQMIVIGPQTITGKYKPSETDQSKAKGTRDSGGYYEFRVEKGSIKDEEIEKLLAPRPLTYKFDRASDWGTYLIIALPILLFLAFFMMMFRSSRMT